MEGPGDGLGDLPEVGIGDDEAARGRGWHAPSYEAPLTFAIDPRILPTA